MNVSVVYEPNPLHWLINGSEEGKSDCDSAAEYAKVEVCAR